MCELKLTVKEHNNLLMIIIILYIIIILCTWSAYIHNDYLRH